MGSSIGVLFILAIAAFYLVASWKLFEKAGEPGWGAIIPIYNSIVMLRMAGKPWWWILAMCVPFVNIILTVIFSIDLAKAFGKGTGFGIGVLLLSFIFIPVLAFGDAEYMGPGGSAGSRIAPAF